MLISKIKILVAILILSFVNVSCTNVKKAFDPEKKDSSEEFLVEKKTPLSMPPDFDKLPLPKSSEIKAQDEDKEIQKLIENEEINIKVPKDNKNSKLEDLILEKIKDN